MENIDNNYELTGLEVAIVGMAGRFPNADTVEELWDIFIKGKDVVSTLTDEELLSEGLSELIINNPNYIRKKGLLKNLWGFDGKFFGYSEKEVEIMDPQMRLLHEITYEALEDSGYVADDYDGDIGLYAGGLSNRVWETIAASHKSGFTEMFDAIHLLDKDFASSRVSNKLNLKGPSVSIATACTTSLSAVHTACRALLNGDCNMAIAGGYSVVLPEKSGHFYVENSITSQDGTTRPFDANGTGTCFGDGAAVVVLKLLEDAKNDRDHIYAVIKGSAINNDGANKPLYTASNPEGIVRVVKKAFSFADVLPETINFVEANATGTQMGDYIEVEALKMGFNTDKKGFCRIGSHKPNIGYLGPASGVISLIKAALSLKYKMLPASLNYEKSNENIDFANSPFVVNGELTDLSGNKNPLRAGVNNIAVGGTNVHVILEEAPPKEKSNNNKEWYLLPISAKSESALEQLSLRYHDYLVDRNHQNVNLCDIEYTLVQGRKGYEYRRIILCNDLIDASAKFVDLDGTYVRTSKILPEKKKVVFLLPDVSTKSIVYIKKIYENYDLFQVILDECFTVIRQELGIDIKDDFFSEPSIGTTKDIYAFTTEYAYAKFFMEIGIVPETIICDGIGEYVAACISSVMNLKDAYHLISIRNRMIDKISDYKLFRLHMSYKDIRETFGEKCIVSVIESEQKCIVAVEKNSETEFLEIVEKDKILIYEDKNLLKYNIGLNQEELQRYLSVLEKIDMMDSKITVLSSVSQETADLKQMNTSNSSKEYWMNQFHYPVNVAKNIGNILKEDNVILINMGYGNDYNKIIASYSNNDKNQKFITPVKNIRESYDENQKLLIGLGELWTYGESFDFVKINGCENANKISLPKNYFEKTVSKLNYKVGEMA